MSGVDKSKVSALTRHDRRRLAKALAIYYRRLLKEGANVVLLEPGIAKVFQDSAAVNDALRSLLEVTRSTQRLTARSRRTA